MTANIPEGVDMRRADPDYQTYEGYLPTVPNPLDVKDPATEVFSVLSVPATWVAPARPARPPEIAMAAR